jgi:hypothetical protein
MLEVAEDWRLDPTLHGACEEAADTLCEEVEPGQGREIECLVRGRRGRAGRGVGAGGVKRRSAGG